MALGMRRCYSGVPGAAAPDTASRVGSAGVACECEPYHQDFVWSTTMTRLLEKALGEVAKLPPSEQDALASILLDELASEKQWLDTFANSQDALASLSDEALVEHRAGKTEPC